MNFNKEIENLLEHFHDASNIMQNEKGEKWSVPKIVKFAEKNKEKYFKKDFPISKLKHELKWWNKQNKEDPKHSNERVQKADTSYPLLVIKDSSYGLSVADGLNRLKRAISIEDRKTIDVYIVPKKDIPEDTKVN